MKRHLVLLILFFTCAAPSGYSQSKSFAGFDTVACSFSGTRLEQAESLLRNVLPRGVIDKEDQTIPDFLSGLLKDEVPMVSQDDLDQYISVRGLTEEEIGGSISDSISKNKRNFHARYFVIHDVSTPNYKRNEFPADINEKTWPYNNVKKKWNVKKAHVFIGRTGESYSPVYFNTAWRATKFELDVLDQQISRGLFIHAELVQPRRSDTSAWTNNDILAPSPGFTADQYHRLALMYVIASFRSGEWMVPVFHSVLDEGIAGAHDDPQNFSLPDFDHAIEKIYDEVSQINTLKLWATYYYVPTLDHVENGVELLDEQGNGLGLKLDSCDWCTACIQGTVIVNAVNQRRLLNYAGRSNKLQYDCRTCSVYQKYDGYEKTGKVLWQESSGYGYGVKQYQLVPFKTIAVDSSVIPFGSVVYMPDAKGVAYAFEDTMLVHDGYFFAADMGSKIKGNHIDVFIGTATSNPFEFVKSDSNQSFFAELIDDSVVVNRLDELHRFKKAPNNDYLVRICEEDPCELGTPSGYINNAGDTVISFGRFNYCYTDTIKHYGIVLDTNGVCIAIDNSGQYLYDVLWVDNGPDNLVEGLFRIRINGEIGYANELGNIVIDPQFACATAFENGRAKVTHHCNLVSDGEHKAMVSDTWFYIDKAGQRVAP
jgi:3D (Asp-Asp-Asp) domain-containing protein